MPPKPFTLDELDPAGFPDRVYSKDELETYLRHCRQKCRATLVTMTDVKVHSLCKFTWGEMLFAELLLYNLRHVQEHGAQLNLFIGQEIGRNARWVAQGTRDLDAK